MTKKLRFTAAARDQMDDIADWTVETFGTRQAKDYEKLILERLGKLIDGTAFTRPVTPSDPRRALRAGQHVVVFIERDTEFVVLAILHSRSDLLAHLPETKED